MRDIVKKILEECHRHSPKKHKSIREIVRMMADTIRLNMIQIQLHAVFLLKNEVP